MRRIVIGSMVAVVLAASFALPVLAGQPRTVVWVCDVPGEGRVEFVTAAEAARHGITQANSRAGVVFLNQFGEVCTVE
jgi:hypothetical protein